MLSVEILLPDFDIISVLMKLVSGVFFPSSAEDNVGSNEVFNLFDAVASLFELVEKVTLDDSTLVHTALVDLV